MSAFSYTYTEVGNLLATIIQANTLRDLHALYAANLKMFRAIPEVQRRYDLQREMIMRRKPDHDSIIK